MRVWNWGLPVGALMAVALAAAGPAQGGPALSQTTLGAEASKADLDGKPVGCDLVFTVVRGAPDRTGDQISGSISVLVMDDVWGAASKIAYIRNSDRRLRPPSLVLLGETTADNAADLLGQSPSDDERYSIFAYRAGPSTIRALTQLAHDGTLGLMVSQPDGGREGWTVDLTANPKALADWRACMASYALLPPALSQGGEDLGL